MCAYNTTGVSAHSSIQPFIDSLTSLAGSGNVRCLVRTSNVPSTTVGTHFIPEDSLETRNFGVAVHYNGKHYGVDISGVVVLDDLDSYGGLTANWNNAKNICAVAGKRLPSLEILKSVYDYNGSNGFTSSGYWSSTHSAISVAHAYAQYFDTGNIGRHTIAGGGHVRCAS